LYSATEEGSTVAEELVKALSPETRDYLTRVVEWTGSLSFNDLVSAIYHAYPEMKKNSVFQE
jgi:hypothetical protein